MTDAIVIYHCPQECGYPSLTFLSRQTGEVLEKVYLPDPSDYYTSGSRDITTYYKVSSFRQKICQGPHRPTVDNVKPRQKYLSDPRRYVYKVTRVTDIKESEPVPGYKVYDAVAHVDCILAKRGESFCAQEDSFRHQMEEAGFDMRGWCLYKRRKHSYWTFIRDVASKYKDYHLVNLIEIR